MYYHTRPIVQRQKPKLLTVKQWSPAAIEDLQASLDLTDWDVFIDASEDIDELTQRIADYVNFCVDCTVPDKQIKVYANNKPWITKEVKKIINKKKKIFGQNNRDELRAVQKELGRAIKKGKDLYKCKIDSHFTGNNMKEVWAGIRLMSCYMKDNRSTDKLPNTSREYANELNVFYNRFDHLDFSHEIGELREMLSMQSYPQQFLTVTAHQVRAEFSKLNVSKAAGPDGLLPRVLKLCSNQLCNIFAVIFNMSFNTQTVPTLWKRSCIIPIPKKNSIACMNDLRPVALTSVAM
ncbi:hypothetical protein BSL78_22452 [Apostichopus japonicus]|uniref:RNA-directed DNA polymerase from mobile element jockey-like n=1 Tax=Stichopus japonicus TaxID=307972 RepID=A0A2G8JY63_STIJA|nr:hypothetical protein BSL78_22452 [Apostichopus japonicus]